MSSKIINRPHGFKDKWVNILTRKSREFKVHYNKSSRNIDKTSHSVSIYMISVGTH